MQNKPFDELSCDYINERIRDFGIDIDVETLKVTDSTNNVLKLKAVDGVKSPRVCIAEEQTAGRGRRGRSFYSPSGSGIYISFLLFPDIPIDEASMLTTVAATAAAAAIEEVSGFPVSIKWVNDIWMRGKKVSGILTEASPSLTDGSLEYVIVGIGINLYEPAGGFPDDIKDIAGSVFTDNEPVGNLRNDIAAALIINFMNYVNKGIDNKEFLTEYEKRLFVIGKDVTLISPDHESLADNDPSRTTDTTGTDTSGPDSQDPVVRVLGINEKCHLHVRHQDGREEFLSSGEISIRI